MSSFGKDLGLMHEVVITGRKAGATERFWAALAHREDVFQKTVPFVLSLIAMVFRLRPDFEPDKPSRLKKLEKDSPAKEGEFIPEIEEFLRGEDESSIGEEELMRRLHGRDDIAGQRHLEAMARDQEALPEEWREFELVVPETIWATEEGSHYIPVLRFYDRRWQLFFYSSCNGFSRRYRVVRIKK